MTKTKITAKSFDSITMDRAPFSDKCDPFVKIVGERAIKFETIRHFDMDRQSNSISFTIQPTNHQYIIPHATTLEMELQFKKTGAQNVPAVPTNAGDDEVFCVNLPGASLFKNVTLSVRGEEQQTLSTNHYGYKALIQHYMSYGNNMEELLDSTLYPRHYYVEDPEDVQNVEKTIVVAAGRNNDPPARQYQSVSSTNMEQRKLRQPWHKAWKVITPLFCDLFQGGKLQAVWPSSFKIQILMELAKPAFYCMTTNALGTAQSYYIHINKATLNVKYVEFFEDIQSKYLGQFKEGKALNFYYPRTQMISYNINQNTTQVMKSNIFTGVLPCQIVIAMTATEGFLGKYNLNPYNLHHYDLSELQVNINGVNKIPPNIHWDFEQKEYMSLYNLFLENCKRGVCDRNDLAHQITYKKFGNGFFFLPINIGPTVCMDTHNHIPMHTYGDLGLRLEFKKPLPQEVTLMVYGLYASNVELSIGSDSSHEIQVIVPLDKRSEADY